MARRVNESANVSPRSVALNANVGVKLSGTWKLVISLLLLLHLLAVVAEPFALFTRGAGGLSPAAAPVRRNMAPYIEFAYLNHGYFFFAPNPAPSHLLECKLASANGDQSRLRLPDRSAQWPRLLYHRHFMLAEFLHQLHVEPVTEPDIANTPDRELLGVWRAERARFEMVRDSMIKHLKHRYGVESAEIFRLEHRLPSDVEVFRDKLPLNDERLYVVLPDAAISESQASLSGVPVPEPLPVADKRDGKPILNSKAGSDDQVTP